MYDYLAFLARWRVVVGIVLVLFSRPRLHVQVMQLVIDPYTQILGLNPSTIGQWTVVWFVGIFCPFPVGLIETGAMPGEQDQ